MSNSSNNSISFCGLLTITFIILKLLGVIDWSWWWVLAPIWLPAAIAIIVILFLTGVIAVIGSKIDITFKKRK